MTHVERADVFVVNSAGSAHILHIPTDLTTLQLPKALLILHLSGLLQAIPAFHPMAAPH